MLVTVKIRLFRCITGVIVQCLYQGAIFVSSCSELLVSRWIPTRKQTTTWSHFPAALMRRGSLLVEFDKEMS